MNKSDLIRIINEEINYTLDGAESTTVNEVVDPIYDSNFPEIVAGMIAVGIALKQIVKFLAHKGLNRDEIKDAIKKGKGDTINESVEPTRLWTTDKYLGIDIKHGNPRLIIRQYQDNPYGGNPWKLLFMDEVMSPSDLTKEYIMARIKESYKNPEKFSSEADELVSIIRDKFEI